MINNGQWMYGYYVLFYYKKVRISGGQNDKSQAYKKRSDNRHSK